MVLHIVLRPGQLFPQSGRLIRLHRRPAESLRQQAANRAVSSGNPNRSRSLHRHTSSPASQTNGRIAGPGKKDPPGMKARCVRILSCTRVEAFGRRRKAEHFGWSALSGHSQSNPIDVLPSTAATQDIFRETGNHTPAQAEKYCALLLNRHL